MCGLVGMYGSGVTPARAEVFKWLLHFDVKRGEDSTGVAIRITEDVTLENDILLIKEVGHPSQLYTRFSDIFDRKGNLRPKLFEGRKPTFLMGHNRKATIGKVTYQNAHPFNCFPIIGAHNGTLNSGIHTVDLIKRAETDSERFYWLLSDAKGELEKAVKAVTGAGSFSYWNDLDQTFNLFRNSERPLSYVMSKDRRSFVYASEAGMLTEAIKAAREEHFYDPDEIKEIKIDTHYAFSTDTFGRVEFKEATLSLKKSVVTHYQGSHQHTNHGAGHYSSYKGGGKIKSRVGKLYRPAFLKTSKTQPPLLLTNEVEPEDDGFVFGWLNRSNDPKVEIEKALRSGCQMCSTNLDYDDHANGEVFWFDKATPLCKPCAVEWKVKE
jgi:hypothetical protein